MAMFDRNFFATAAVMACTAAGPALADCRSGGTRFHFTDPAPVAAVYESDGAACRHNFHAGALGSLTSASIIAKPQHGALSQTRNFAFVYTPTKGFKGIDAYSVKVCGSDRQGAGCATIAYSTTIK